MTKTLIASAVAALVLVVAGCGGSDESSSTASPTDEWATGFCTAVTDWTDSLKSVTDEFSSPSSLSTDALQNAATDIKDVTQTFVDQVKGLGAPDTESGEEVKSSVDELATTLETEMANIETAANNVSGLTGLPSAISSITTSMSAMSQAFSSTMQTLESADGQGELQSALEASPACASISG